MVQNASPLDSKARQSFFQYFRIHLRESNTTSVCGAKHFERLSHTIDAYTVATQILDYSVIHFGRIGMILTRLPQDWKITSFLSVWGVILLH
jgi:hypothetical protein